MRQIDYIDVYMNVYSHEMKSEYVPDWLLTTSRDNTVILENVALLIHLGLNPHTSVSWGCFRKKKMCYNGDTGVLNYS